MNDALVHEIVTRFHAGMSVRRIAESLHLGRGTVRRVLEQIEHARSTGMPQKLLRAIPRRGSQLDAYQTAIIDLLARYPNITAQRIHEELRGLGYQGSYTSVSERVRALRPRPGVQPVRRFETAPGEQAQMDYSTYDLDFTVEGRRRVHAFSYVLGYSRRQYVHFVESQDFATTVREHVRAFEHLGGAAATCLYDNMKVVVSGYDGDQPIYNARFLGFAAHYGFRPIACRPRRPQTKGKVERPFGYVESSLLGGRTFRSLEHLNETTKWWLADVSDVHVHRQTKARPLDRHAEELSRLLPLPAQPYDTSEVFYRNVDAEGFVVCRQNFYAVPWRLIGQAVVVRVTQDQLAIYDQSFVVVASHQPFAKTVTGGRSLCPDHEPPRDSRERQQQLEERFAEFGPAGTQFLKDLLSRSRYGKNQAERVLSLVAAYPRQDVPAALERAVRYGAFSLSAVQRILAAQSRPKMPLDALADDHRSYLEALLEREPTPPRPTSDYQPLLDQRSHDAEPSESQESADTKEGKPHDQGSDSAPPS